MKGNIICFSNVGGPLLRSVFPVDNTDRPGMVPAHHIIGLQAAQEASYIVFHDVESDTFTPLKDRDESLPRYATTRADLLRLKELIERMIGT